jgi:hypothetical protein
MRVCTLIGTLTLLLCSSACAQDGLQLLHRMQKALGGADKIASIRDSDELVHAQTWHDDGSPRGDVHKRTRWISPNCLRLDQVGQNDNTYVLYFDGSSGWEIIPDTSGAVELAGDELKFAEGYLRGLKLKFWLADRDRNYLITSPAPNIVRIADKRDSQSAEDITLDPVSWLPVKQTSQRGETQFKEWEMVQGIRYPHVTSMAINGKTVAVITVDQIKLNSGLKQSDFAAKPLDLKPNLGIDVH